MTNDDEFQDRKARLESGRDRLEACISAHQKLVQRYSRFETFFMAVLGLSLGCVIGELIQYFTGARLWTAADTVCTAIQAIYLVILGFILPRNHRLLRLNRIAVLEIKAFLDSPARTGLSEHHYDQTMAVLDELLKLSPKRKSPKI
jgi:hypothetical protein